MREIEIKNISFGYDNTLVLENINLDINSGDFLAIIGPNGGGKSTLLRLILGLLSTNKGNIIVDKNKLGYVPQNTTFNKDFPISVLDVVLMGLLNNKQKMFGYTKAQLDLALWSLDKVGMSDFKDKKIGNLSGGQRQRVFIARALCSKPKILLLDEPTSSIDVDGQQKIYTLLKELNKEMTIVVVSHDISLITSYATKVAFVNKRLHMHDHLNNITPKNMHFCEVELLNNLKSCKC